MTPERQEDILARVRVQNSAGFSPKIADDATTASKLEPPAPRRSRVPSFAMLFFLVLAVYGLVELLRGSLR